MQMLACSLQIVLYLEAMLVLDDDEDDGKTAFLFMPMLANVGCFLYRKTPVPHLHPHTPSIAIFTNVEFFVSRNTD
jgi:hypothetical protein